MNKYFRVVLTVLSSLYFWHYVITYTKWHFLDFVNLIFHEAGHVIFFFLGHFLQIAAGSGLQIALPLFISLYFFYHRQYVSGSVCLLWVGQNFLNVSVYARDAIAMELPLLGGDSVIHDWNYLLSTTNLLSHTPFIASTLYAIGIIFISFGTIFSIYFAWQEPTENTSGVLY